ncbi:MAG TPA: type II secretion system F family protein [Candidatus Saccharimonadales bacterium]|nr:type II secretion system F family protein [Candidatus Saccharimonadales bacterium]
MPSFSYTAKDKSGQVIKGNVSGMDKSAAVASLQEKGLSPILVKDSSDKPSTGLKLGNFHLGGKVKLTDKVIFSRQFATMVNAGVPITQSLSILREQATSKPLKSALADAGKRVEGGSTLSAALAEHPRIFSPIYINMVKAGEAGGLLDEVLERLAVQQEKDAEIVGKVKSAMIYPAVITTVTVAAFIFLMTVIVPKLAVIFEGLGSSLPWYTKLMLSISGALTHFGIFIALGVGGAGYVFYRFIKTPTGKKGFDTFLTHAPIAGPIVVKMNVARFARTFGSLMASGISVLDALNATSTALNNNVFKHALGEIGKDVKAGKTISEPLKKFKVFPPIVSQMIAVGEETGQLDSILTKLADFYEKEVDAVIAGITSIIEPVLIIVLGGMVGFIVISVFGPLAALNNAV